MVFFTLPEQYFFFLIGGKLVYSVVLVSAVQQHESAIIIHISLPSWTSLPPYVHPTHLGHQRGLSWAPCVIQQLPTSYLFYIW